MKKGGVMTDKNKNVVEVEKPKRTRKTNAETIKVKPIKQDEASNSSKEVVARNCMTKLKFRIGLMLISALLLVVGAATCFGVIKLVDGVNKLDVFDGFLAVFGLTFSIASAVFFGISFYLFCREMIEDKVHPIRNNFIIHLLADIAGVLGGVIVIASIFVESVNTLIDVFKVLMAVSGYAVIGVGFIAGVVSLVKILIAINNDYVEMKSAILEIRDSIKSDKRTDKK